MTIEHHTEDEVREQVIADKVVPGGHVAEFEFHPEQICAGFYHVTFEPTNPDAFVSGEVIDGKYGRRADLEIESITQHECMPAVVPDPMNASLPFGMCSFLTRLSVRVRNNTSGPLSTGFKVIYMARGGWAVATTPEDADAAMMTTNAAREADKATEWKITALDKPEA